MVSDFFWFLMLISFNMIIYEFINFVCPLHCVLLKHLIPEVFFYYNVGVDMSSVFGDDAACVCYYIL